MAEVVGVRRGRPGPADVPRPGEYQKETRAGGVAAAVCGPVIAAGGGAVTLAAGAGTARSRAPQLAAAGAPGPGGTPRSSALLRSTLSTSLSLPLCFCVTRGGGRRAVRIPSCRPARAAGGSAEDLARPHPPPARRDRPTKGPTRRRQAAPTRDKGDSRAVAYTQLPATDPFSAESALWREKI